MGVGGQRCGVVFIAVRTYVRTQWNNLYAGWVHAMGYTSGELKYVRGVDDALLFVLLNLTGMSRSIKVSCFCF